MSDKNPSSSPRKSAVPSRKETALTRLFSEVRGLNNRLRWMGDHLHTELGLTSATRSILLDLHRGGPQTVPDLARVRLLSRQILQTQVNSLLDLGVVETMPNPRHKRSSLIRLSRKGHGIVERIRQKEARIIEENESSLEPEKMEELARQLSRIRAELEEVGVNEKEN